MWLFDRQKRQEQAQEREAVIQAIRKDTFNKIEEATEKTERVNKLLDDRGITYLLFLATGGGRRNNGKY